MVRVNILTPGFTSPNGVAFLFPLIAHRSALRDAGIHIVIHKSDRNLPRLADCDVLILDSKFYSPRWISESDAVLDRIAALGEAAPRLFYFDITDSSGWDHARALPFVTGYFKNQLLRDRSLYLRPHVGYRLHADHYHRTNGVTDEDGAVSEPVPDPAQLDKLHLGWNSGLANYDLRGPETAKLYRRLPWARLLHYSNDFGDPTNARPLDVVCRIGTSYHRETVSHQRRAISKRLSKWISTEKLSRRAYLEEMGQAKIVVSPFGLGEITLRDFEIFMAGSVALKPSMAHMETWPDFFRDEETIASHDWDLEDLEEIIESLLADPERRLAIARRGQELYWRHTVGEQAAALFVEALLAHFAGRGYSARQRPSRRVSRHAFTLHYDPEGGLPPAPDAAFADRYLALWGENLHPQARRYERGGRVIILLGDPIADERRDDAAVLGLYDRADGDAAFPLGPQRLVPGRALRAHHR